MESESLTKRVYMSEVDGDRGGGRPRWRWKDGVKKYVRKGWFNLGESRQMMGDIEAICGWPASSLVGLGLQGVHR